MADGMATASLQALGLSLYEARIYLGLLQGGPQNGNELSKKAGVPSSKVYSTLNKLASTGLVSQSKRDGLSEYVCVSPEELMRRLRAKFLQPLDYLETALPSFAVERPDPDVVTISNWDTICDNARTLVAAASQRVLLSTWAENLDELRDTLAAADARGVEIFAMIYGEASLEVGSWQRHSYTEIVAARIAGHMLTIVADGREALLAHRPERGEPTGILTKNPVICLMAEEYMHHDFMLERAKEITGLDTWDRWWRSEPSVRAAILGRALAADSDGNGGVPTPRRG